MSGVEEGLEPPPPVTRRSVRRQARHMAGLFVIGLLFVPSVSGHESVTGGDHAQPSLQTVLAVSPSPSIVPTPTAVPVAPWTTPPATAASPDTVIYLSPHQDDETLTFGPAIVADLAAGKRVEIVLMTQGTSSTAITAINARLVHESHPEITRQQMAEGRDREFIAAVTGLGIGPSHLHFERLPDGSLSPKVVASVIAKYAAVFPGADFRTMAEPDKNHDHAALAEGLAISSASVKHWLWFRRYWTRSHPTCSYVGGASPQLARAIASYGLWAPQDGRFAVGALYSVPSDFAQETRDPRALLCTDSIESAPSHRQLGSDAL